MSETNCARCGAAFYPRHFYDAEQTKPMDTGYGTDPDTGERVCFECCAIEDLAYMREQGKIDYLYLSAKNKQFFVSNWPGTLRIGPVSVSHGYHNIARSRRDCWFTLDGFVWHGVSLGDWNQVVRCKRTKQRNDKNSPIFCPERSQA